MSSPALLRSDAGIARRSPAPSSAITVDTALGATLLHVTDDLSSLQDLWQNLQMRSPCTAVQTYDWANAWSRHVLGPNSLRPVIAVGYGADGRSAFLWPLQTARVAGFTVLKWLSQEHANYCMGLFQPGTAARLTQTDLFRLLREVARKTGAVAAALEKQPFGWDGVSNPFARLRHQPAPDFGFAATLGDFNTIYMSRISGHARGHLRRTERRIAEHGPLSYGWAEMREERLQILDTLFAQKARQLGELGIKNSLDAHVRAFYREIALLEGDNPSRLRLGYFKVGDTVLATHSGMICHDRLTITLSSLTDGALKLYSPGSLLLRHQIEEAARKGLAFYDLGAGAASYKDKWCDVVEPLFNSFIAFKPRGGLLAFALSSKAHAKRLIKSNPRAWDLVKRIRRTVRRYEPEPG